MRKILFLSLLAFLPLLHLQAGEGEKARKLFASISERYSVTFSMSYAKEHLDAIDTDFDVNGVKKYVEGDFHQVKLQVLESKSVRDVQRLFEKGGYTELAMEADGGDTEGLHLMIDRKGKHIKEAHLLIESKDNVTLLSFFGDLEVTERGR